MSILGSWSRAFGKMRSGARVGQSGSMSGAHNAATCGPLTRVAMRARTLLLFRSSTLPI